MAQVPSCDCGGACSSLNVNTGFCREDTGDPVLITTVCSCNGFTITTTVTDLATGEPYTGALMICSPEIYDVADTNSIDMTLAGTAFSSDLRLDPASPIPLSITANGLYADTAAPSAFDWTTQVKTNNQTFSSTTSAQISGLSGFSPVANGVYEIEGKLIVGSSATNVGVRPSIEFPTGMTHTAHYVATADSAYDNHIFRYGGPSGQTANNNAPAANVGYLARLSGVIVTGATPNAVPVRPNMASDANGSQVFVYAGSMFKWRRIA